MKKITAVLDNRGKTHGEFKDVASICQGTKDLWRASVNWDDLEPFQKEGLEMIAHKVARILSGDANFEDHYTDISGYATVMANRLQGS